MISVKDIQKIEQKRKSILKDTYVAIYQQFCKKIRSVVDAGGNYATLKVPVFVLGHPSFDQRKAAIYLRRQLMNGGFQVKMMGEVDMYVTWSKAPKEKKPETEVESDHDDALPSLINLKKLARNYSK